MSGTTSKGFPFPGNSDPVNIPSDIQALAASVDAFINSFTTTVSSATPIVLTVASNQQQEITGSAAQLITAPVTSTLTKGWKYRIINNSSATVTYESSGHNTIATIPAGAEATFTVLLITGTTAASWDFKYTGTASAGVGFVGCILYRSSLIATAQNVWTMSTFPSETLDTDNFHDTVTNNSRVTIPAGKAGKYLLIAVGVDIESTSGSAVAVVFYKNGANASPTGDMSFTASTSGNTVRLHGSMIVTAVAGDYFELGMFTNGAGCNSNRANFHCVYLGA